MQFIDLGHHLKAIAIALALIAAVALAFGAQLQNDAVDVQRKAALTGRSHITFKQLTALVRRPQWVTGFAISTGALMLQFVSLLLAPIIVVQPIGAIALVITSILNSRMTKTKLNRATYFAVGLCTLGVAAFVTMAHQVAQEPAISDQELILILCAVGLLVTAFGFMFFTGAHRFKALSFIIGAGVLYGFVATLTKVSVKRLFQQGSFDRFIHLKFDASHDFLTLGAILAMLVAALLGGWFVQNAYASGPPDLVIAGLTVIDPMVAVSIGVGILGEASTASMPIIIGFALSGLTSVIGVFMLSKVHPQIASKRL